jgi:hypothetical protein
MDTLETTLNGNKGDSKPRKTEQKTRRHLPSLPSATGASDMNTVTYTALSDKTPIEWASLKNYEVFSLTPDGSFPMLKVSRSKAVRLSDREVLLVGSGRCYRVALSNIPTNTQTQSTAST